MMFVQKAQEVFLNTNWTMYSQEILLDEHELNTTKFLRDGDLRIGLEIKPKNNIMYMLGKNQVQVDVYEVISNITKYSNLV